MKNTLTVESLETKNHAQLIIRGNPADILEYYNGIYNWGGTGTMAFDELENPTEAWESPECLKIFIIKEKFENALFQMAWARQRMFYNNQFSRTKRKEFEIRARYWAKKQLEKIKQVGVLYAEKKEKSVASKSWVLEAEDENGRVSTIRANELMMLYDKFGIRMPKSTCAPDACLPKTINGTLPSELQFDNIGDAAFMRAIECGLMDKSFKGK